MDGHSQGFKTLNSFGREWQQAQSFPLPDLVFCHRHLITGLNRNTKQSLLPLFSGPKILFVLQASKTGRDNGSYTETATCSYGNINSTISYQYRFCPKYFNMAHVFLIIKVMPHIIIDNRILKLPLKG